MLYKANPLAKVDCIAVLVVEEAEVGIELAQVDDVTEGLYLVSGLLLLRSKMKDVVNDLQVLSPLHLQFV